MILYEYYIEKTYHSTDDINSIPEGVDYTSRELNYTEEVPKQLALHYRYPETINLSYKFLVLDNLEGIKREVTLSDKGLKGEKKYTKDGLLIFSSQKFYWFEDNQQGNEGYIRTIKLYNTDGTIGDTWSIYYQLSEDDKSMFKEEQRRLIFNYFKSQQPQLFDLLYSVFKLEIDTYLMKGGDELRNALISASESHSLEIVVLTLNSIVTTQSNGTIRVLDGILNELI